MTGTVVAVCAAGTPVTLARTGDTGIAKTPLAGAVAFTTEGIDGDLILDRTHHGGPDQAVYAYSEAEAKRWSQEIGFTPAPGWFGENLRLADVAVSDALIGERWRIGTDVVVEVSMPRVPCRTFAEWAERPQWVKRFTERGDVGTYLRVVTEGEVRAGDAVQVLSRPDRQVSIRDFFAGTVSDELLTQLASAPEVAAKVRSEAQRALRVRARDR
ncbi:MOSC domain-containing protein [Williamsia sp. CHRR-6]|uniref:MOSC domain-containing protein n=1 Tax=Williamsia sp. CHRR-6 TaxID=2835871 RepID=UPI001BDB60E2|nr:MOSC domain-containing protein [Williamsia sp. CHRR-6]MBT0566321.1 MOSC domain-containing protein [Williamsia sp. CHRR-6]